MKTAVFAFAFLVIINTLSAQDPTAFGAPDGKIASKEISNAGGRIVSEDGGVELIFPAGALTTNTIVSIQPVTNQAANGSGKAYLFEPSGIQFKKPVQIIFHYTNEEDETCPAELMALATQDHTGRWNFFDYNDYDSTTKTLMGTIRHFSYYTKVNKIKLRPMKRELMANDETSIEVLDLAKIVDTGKYRGDYEIAYLRASNTYTWYVNGYKNGNKFVGEIDPFIASLGKNLRFMSATYIAPKYLPAENSVTIKLAVTYFSKKLNKQLTRNCKTTIAIYDAYKITFIQKGEVRPTMGNEIIDSGSFILWIYPDRVKMDNIQNYTVSYFKQGEPRHPCLLQIETADAPGLIHITETMKNYRAHRVKKEDPLEIFFEFSSFEVLAYKFRWKCRGIRSTSYESVFVKASPINVYFIANGEEQHEVRDQRDEYRMIVKPYRER